jgi:hypothetical protein
MSAATTPTPAGSAFDGAFWERLWRSAGIQSAVLFVAAFFLYGHQPQIGASADELSAFYAGERARILIAAILFGMAMLNLLWFAAAIRATHMEKGKDGWGSALTASSAAFGAVFLLFVALTAGLAYSITGSVGGAFVSALNDLSWAIVVLSSFPRAMLIMSGSFGLWRAGLISNTVFALCVAALVLVLLGGTTWMGAGVWAPDGLYSTLISPVICLVWVASVSLFLLRRPAAGTGW